jgi:hypothetical protein
MLYKNFKKNYPFLQGADTVVDKRVRILTDWSNVNTWLEM